MTVIATKVCVRCRMEKPEESFWKRDSGRRRASCSECMAPRRREYYREYDAKRPDRRSRWNRENYQKHREARIASHSVSTPHVIARRKLRWALDSGKITRPTTCGRCGSSGAIEAHHEDYSRPMDVTWLCRPCHGLTRRKP